MEGHVLTTIEYKVSNETPAHLLELVTAIDRLPRKVSETAYGFLVASAFDLRMNAFGGNAIVQGCIQLARRVVGVSVIIGRNATRLAELLGPTSQHSNGTKSIESTCERYLSLIVLNLERAGMLAIRKVFPACLALDCGDRESLST